MKEVELSIEEERTERARQAVRVFRGMIPSLTGFARALTKNKQVRVQLTTSAVPHTDGRIIFYRPPISLGDRTPHKRSLCDLRGDQYQLLCPACLVREVVIVNILHEIAHIVEDSFEKVDQATQDEAIQRALNTWPSRYEEKIREVIANAPQDMMENYQGLATLIHPYLPTLVNSLEDARIDSTMFRVRKGTRKMFIADMTRIFEEGFETPDGWKTIRDSKLNTQMMVASYVAAMGLDFDDWFSPPVVEALHDEQLSALLSQATKLSSQKQTYNLAFPVLYRMRDLGFCRLPEDKDEEDRTSTDSSSEAGPDGLPGGETESEDSGLRASSSEDSKSDGQPSDQQVESDSNSDSMRPDGDDGTGVRPDSGDRDEGTDGDSEGDGIHQVEDSTTDEILSDHSSSDHHDGNSEGRGEEGGDNLDETSEVLGEGPEASEDESSDDPHHDDALGSEEGASGAGDGDSDDDVQAVGGAESSGDGVRVDQEGDVDSVLEPSDSSDVAEQGLDSESSQVGEREEQVSSPPSSAQLDDADSDYRDSESSDQDSDASGSDGHSSGPGEESNDPGVRSGGDELDVDLGQVQDLHDQTDASSSMEAPVSPDMGAETDGEASDQSRETSSQQSGGPNRGSADGTGRSRGDRDTLDESSGESHHQEASESSVASSDSNADAPRGVDDSSNRPPGDELGKGDRLDESGEESSSLPLEDDDSSEPQELEHSDSSDLSEGATEASSGGGHDGSLPRPEADGSEPNALAEGAVGDDGGIPEDEYGGPDEAAGAFQSIHGVISQERKDESEEEAAQIIIAVIQGQFFDTPAVGVWGVHVHTPENHYHAEDGEDLAMAWTEYTLDDNSEGWLAAAGVVPPEDMTVDEEILGPAVMLTRRVFHENKKVRMQRGRKRGRIDPRALGKRAWRNDPHIMKKKVFPDKKDYDVLLGVDISYSQFGESLLLTKRAAMAQCELLHRASVPFALMAHSAIFTPEYDKLILDMYKIKEVHQPWDTRAIEAFASMGAVMENLDGHGLEFYRKAIQNSTATTKIILYYTDGLMPAANYDEELEVLQREIKMCKKLGITVLGVGIQTESPIQHGLDTVRVDSDEDLPRVVEHLDKILVR